MDDAEMKRGWFLGCPQCGANFYVRNAGVEREGGTCDNCTGWPNDDAVRDHSDCLVSTELGWCGCGSPEDVDRMMLAYLASVDAPGAPKPKAEGVGEDAELLLSYIADDLGWTEHGGSVYGAWMTDAGRTALENLRASALRPDGD